MEQEISIVDIIRPLWLRKYELIVSIVLIAVLTSCSLYLILAKVNFDTKKYYHQDIKFNTNLNQKYIQLILDPDLLRKAYLENGLDPFNEGIEFKIVNHSSRFDAMKENLVEDNIELLVKTLDTDQEETAASLWETYLNFDTGYNQLVLTDKNFNINLNLESSNDRYIYLNGFYDKKQISFVESQLDLNKFDYFLDIGSNIGFYSLYFASKYKNLNIFAFEPIHENYNQIEKSIKINNFKKIEIFKYALSNKKDTKIMWVTDLRKKSGFSVYENDDFKNEISINNYNIDKIYKRTIKSEIFDDQIKIENKNIFIKIDVERHEFQCLSGMLNLLKDHNNKIFIQIEIIEKYKDLEITVIPVGITYQHTSHYPAKVSINYGKPITTRSLYESHPIPKSTRILKEKVQEQLKVLSVHIPDNLEYERILQQLNNAQIDFTEVTKTNEMIEARKFPSKKPPKKNYLKPLLYLIKLNSILPYIIWKKISKNINEVEFIDTFRFSLNLFLCVLFYSIQATIISRYFGSALGLFYLTTSALLIIIYVKLAPTNAKEDTALV